MIWGNRCLSFTFLEGSSVLVLFCCSNVYVISIELCSTQGQKTEWITKQEKYWYSWAGDAYAELTCLRTRHIFLYLYIIFLTHTRTTFIPYTHTHTHTHTHIKTTWKDKLFKLLLEARERRETLLLGLGRRYFFYHYPGHWLPSGVSITQAKPLHCPTHNSTLTAPCGMFSQVPLEWPMMMQIRVPWWPVVVNNSLNRHWSTAFVSIKFETPPITLRITMNPHASVKWDLQRCIRLQLF